MSSELEHIEQATKLSSNDIYNVLGDFQKIFARSVDLTNIIQAVTQLMNIVGQIKGLPGKDKKFVVTKMALHLVKETNVGTFDEMFDIVMVNIIPTVIDQLIDVENGKLVFNRKISKGMCFKFS